MTRENMFLNTEGGTEVCLHALGNDTVEREE